jgi:spore cortex formation protein SpoVR/YcgB (stage V sporulation)
MLAVTGDKPMSDLKEQTVNALTILFDKVDTLRRMNIRDMLKPDIYYHYENTLQAAYDALTTVEDALTSLGMKLEYEHWRLGGAVEELKPLMLDARSPSDKIIEEFEQRFS